jgi:small subunit ribosomal protein S21|tara:strand:- start:1650 stop:1892 length:243 start_codon:yes stop_codon:yes gene_type:complete
VSITVEVRGGNLEKALRVLKKKVQKAGIVKDIRAKQYFSKPSEIKREKAKERFKVIRKAQKANDELLGYRWVKGVKVKKI